MATRNAPPRGAGNKGNKFKSAAGAAGAAAGGFVGAMGQSFVPPVNITINRTQHVGGGGSVPQQGGGSQFVLGEPAFDNTDDVRAYCNHVRALMVQCAIELAMAAKILEARLSQAMPLPGENKIQTALRARRVGWKLKRASDGAVAVAKNAVAAHAAFQREYADVIRPRPQQAPVNQFKF
ncbi:plasmid transfer protein TraA [Streptomyces naphthomycinicus]|uniref:plasmid transfer protein TraA n=1 Tax=Streptomyces naphthomycinicus TaxID=2872625 RepID=UPI001CED43A5|nr:plasmid transfer protein TraA [Streptomyces sp. TML10]